MMRQPARELPALLQRFASPSTFAWRRLDTRAGTWQGYRVCAVGCVLAELISWLAFPELLWSPLVAFLVAVTGTVLYGGIAPALASIGVGLVSIPALIVTRAPQIGLTSLVLRELGFLAAAGVIALLTADFRKAGEAWRAASERDRTVARLAKSLLRARTVKQVATLAVHELVAALDAQAGCYLKVSSGSPTARASVLSGYPQSRPAGPPLELTPADQKRLASDGVLFFHGREEDDLLRRLAACPVGSSHSGLIIPVALPDRLMGIITLAFTSRHQVSIEEQASAVVIAAQCAEVLELIRAAKAERQAYADSQAEKAKGRVLETIGDGFVALDGDWRFTYLNARALEAAPMWALQPDRAILGAPFWDVLIPELANQLREPLVEAKEEQQNVDVEVRYGRTRWYLVSAYPSEQGISMNWHDITGRKLVEQRLRFFTEVGNQFSATVDFNTVLLAGARLAVPALADACVIDLSPDGESLRRAVEMLDTESEPLARADAPPMFPRPAIRKVLAGGKPAVFATGLPPGEWPSELRDVGGCSVVAGLKARGRTLGVITFVRHAARKAYEANEVEMLSNFADRLALAVENAGLYRDLETALEVRDGFLRAVSHDLRSPLAAIKLRAAIIQRKLPADAEVTPWVQQGMTDIQSGVARMLSMVDELLDIARIAAGETVDLRREESDLLAVLRGAVSEQQLLTSAHVLHLSAPDRPIVGLWDVGRLRRVFDNLLGNAVKYSPAGGDVNIAVELAGDSVSITVEDHGIGIPPEDLPRIFELFHRGANVGQRAVGTGIGLTSVRFIVEQHGGSVRASSRQGEGSTFRIDLPVVSA